MTVFTSSGTAWTRTSPAPAFAAVPDATPEADAEIIAMVIETLQKAGLREFQISVGHVQFFECLTKEAGFNEQIREELKQLIKNKNTFGVEKLLSKENISAKLKELFVMLPTLFGGGEVLEKALTMTGGTEAAKAILRLQEVLEILKVYELDRYVSFDLGMLSNYMYYTGIIFRGYTYGTGDAVVKGGRYDDLLKHFGKNAPSIGFVAVINQLMNALSRQKIDIQTEHGRYLILYRKQERKEAIEMAMSYRRQGKYVELLQIADGETAKEDREYMTCGNYISVIRMGEL